MRVNVDIAQSSAEVAELEVRKLKTLVQKLQEERFESQRKIAEHDAMLKSARAALLERDTEIDNKKATVASYDEQLKALFVQIRALETQLKASQGAEKVLDKHNKQLVDDAARLDARVIAMAARMSEQLRVAIFDFVFIR